MATALKPKHSELAKMDQTNSVMSVTRSTMLSYKRAMIEGSKLIRHWTRPLQLNDEDAVVRIRRAEILMLSLLYRN